MFRSADRSPRRRNRAVTLIEAVLYISIALALIVGGLVFFQQASTAAKTSTMVRQLSATIAEARVMFHGLPDGPSGACNVPVWGCDMTSTLISAGAVPTDMVTSATSLSNPFGGTTSFRYFNWGLSYGRVVYIDLTNVPQAVCARLLTSTAGKLFTGDIITGSTSVVSYGFVLGGVDPTSSPVFYMWSHIMNPTQAGWMCKYGSFNYLVPTIEPTTTPLSGNVNVSMAFKVDI